MTFKKKGKPYYTGYKKYTSNIKEQIAEKVRERTKTKLKIKGWKYIILNTDKRKLW